jgi:hypothetical protein
MAYWAKVENGVVTQVTIGSQEDADGGYQWLVDNLGGTWLETTLYTVGGVHYDDKGQPDNGRAIRMNTAGIGSTYDSTKDIFIPVSPYPSWVLNDTTYTWSPPVAYPTDGGSYMWDESTKSWVAVQINNTAPTV